MSWEPCSIPENIVSLTTKSGCRSTASDVRLYGHNQFANQSLWSLALILQVWPPHVLRYDSMMWGCRVSSQVCLPWSWELTTITTYLRVVGQRQSGCLVLWSNMVDYRLVNSYSRNGNRISSINLTASGAVVMVRVAHILVATAGHTRNFSEHQLYWSGMFNMRYTWGFSIRLGEGYASLTTRYSVLTRYSFPFLYLLLKATDHRPCR